MSAGARASRAHREDYRGYRRTPGPKAVKDRFVRDSGFAGAESGLQMDFLGADG
jgi:hypothetical protein